MRIITGIEAIEAYDEKVRIFFDAAGFVSDYPAASTFWIENHTKKMRHVRFVIYSSMATRSDHNLDIL